jgi:ergothioneine biosynthesis protein EgtB
MPTPAPTDPAHSDPAHAERTDLEPPPSAETPPGHDLASRYRAVRDATERLCEPLSAEDCAIQSMEEASPAKWHLAHTTWFFETMVLEAHQARYRPFHPEYRVLFNSYYNSVGEQYPRPDRGLLSRPSLDGVRVYRRSVDRAIQALVSESEAGSRVADLVELGIQHEQQHQELLLTDVKHMLSHNPMRPAYREGPARIAGCSVDRAWLRHKGDLRELGHDGAGFAFDNEGPRHQVFLEDFDLASQPVTNGEYLEFMRDGGYQRPELWLSEGWARLGAKGWKTPLYWEDRDGAWHTRTLSGFEPVRPEDPVTHVSYYEADAFGEWAGARLPTEAEWEVAAEGIAIDGNFVESGQLHPSAPAQVGDGPVQLFGDVWEWTRSPYVAYPGYRPPTGTLGEYNGKFMSSQMVLRGGSCATPVSHIRASYRNFFPPDARWQFSGIRLARDAR